MSSSSKKKQLVTRTSGVATPPTSLLEAAHAYRRALDAKKLADQRAAQAEAERQDATEVAAIAATQVASAAHAVTEAEQALLAMAAAIPAPRSVSNGAAETTPARA